MTDIPDDIQRKIDGARKAGWSDSMIMKFAAADIASRQQTTQPVTQKKKGNVLTEALPIAGGVVGGVVGSVFGPAGTIAGGALGSAGGEAIRQKITGEKNTKKIVTEGALGLAGGVAGKVIGTGARVVGKVAGKWISNSAAKAVLKASPSAFGKAADAGIDLPQLFVKYAPKLGNSIDDMVGKVGSKGGRIQKMITDAEAIIGKAARTTGKGVKFTGEEVISALKEEMTNLSGKLGEETKIKALQKIITQAEKKYAKGITVLQARNLLRQANMKFGDTILKTTGDAVAEAAQKVEANTFRTLLREQFPEIAGALDTEKELIILREALTGARNKLGSSAFKLGRIDITRPGTIIDMVFEQPRVASAMTKVGSKLAGKPILASIATGGNVAKESAETLLNNIKSNMFRKALKGTAGQTSVRALVGSPGEAPEEQTSELDKYFENALAEEEGTKGEAIPRENFAAAMMYDMATTGGKNLVKIKTLYDFMNPQSSLPASVMTQIAGSKAAEGIVNELQESIDEVGLASTGVVARGSGFMRRVGAAIGLDPKMREYLALRDAVSSRLARALGEVGTLTDQDIKRATALIPQPEDSYEEASMKLSQLKKLITTSRSGLESTIQDLKDTGNTFSPIELETME